MQQLSRELVLTVHLFAIGAIISSVLAVAVRDPHAAEVLVAALAGFVAGILFDRLVLVPLVDWATARARA